MKIEKKHIIIGGLSVISVALGTMYWQYTRLMDYVIGFNKIKPNKINTDLVDFNLYLNFKNKSDVKMVIESQDYNVYVNDKFITKASNAIPQTIEAKIPSVIAVNVRFNPSLAGTNLLSALLQMGNTKIKIDMKLKVKLWFFHVNIPYVYETTIKDLIQPAK